MPYKSRKKLLQYASRYGRLYRNKNKNNIKYIRRIKENTKIQHRKNKERCNSMYGYKCFICHKKGWYGSLDKPERKNMIRLSRHRKDGKDHCKYCKPWYGYYIKERENFEALCNPCHKGVHFVMRHLGWDWEKIIREIKKAKAR